MSESASKQSHATSLAARFAATRAFTQRLCETLTDEDCVIQSMPDASPVRWHLAHTTWFFESFVLARDPAYQRYHPTFEFLFNSYYNSVGEPFPRPSRGLLSRPGLEEIWSYRRHVDEHLSRLISRTEDQESRRIVELGIHHEQQHQELILTDVKHMLSQNPLFPVYRAAPESAAGEPRPVAWLEYDEGVYAIGHDGEGFAYDNEAPRHRQFVNEFSVADRIVNCQEYLQFIEGGGYRRPELWLSAGWNWVCDAGWQAPSYWHLRDGEWWQFTLAGLQPVAPESPVCHVSYFEADAFARWAGCRLPTEGEWEIASEDATLEGNYADTLLAAGAPLHPAAAAGKGSRMCGNVWQWTASPYTPYPGYAPPEGALGEYNGKFMCNQYVLRGGSCATARSHIRRTYRNFFPPEARWQFSGIRLAR